MIIHQKIAHRDLTPANIMLCWSDQVKISLLTKPSNNFNPIALFSSIAFRIRLILTSTADFGLSKQFNELSFMKSNVGTLVYSCPEIVKVLFREDIGDLGFHDFICRTNHMVNRPISGPLVAFFIRQWFLLTLRQSNNAPYRWPWWCLRFGPQTCWY